MGGPKGGERISQADVLPNMWQAVEKRRFYFCACQTERVRVWLRITRRPPPPPPPPPAPPYLEGVEARDDTPVLHLTALGRVSEFAVLVRARARASLELPAHFQCQPFCVTDLGHVQRHGCTLAKKKKKYSRRFRRITRKFVSVPDFKDVAFRLSFKRLCHFEMKHSKQRWLRELFS